MRNCELDEIVAGIAKGLEDEDLLAIPGLHDFICEHYADDIAERRESNLTIAAEQAAEFHRDAA